MWKYRKAGIVHSYIGIEVTDQAAADYSEKELDATDGKLVKVATMKDEFKRDYLMKAMKLIMGSSCFIKKLGMGTLGKVPAKIGEIMARLNKS